MSQQCSYDHNHDDNDDNGDNDDDNGYTDDDNGYNDDDDVDDDDNGYNNDDNDDDDDDLFAEVSGVRSRTLCRSLTSQGQPDFACRRHRHLDQHQGQVGDDHHYVH